MSLERRSENWVRAAIITVSVRQQILAFESKWKRDTQLLLLGLFGAPLLIAGLAMAAWTVFVGLGPDLGFFLDAAATAMIAIGCFLVILRKVAARGKSIAMSFFNFLIGAALILAAIQVEQLMPYRTLLIWAALVMFSSLLARRLFVWLVVSTGVYLAGLWAVREFFAPYPEADSYLLVALIMGVLTPTLLLALWLFRATIRVLKWLWGLGLTRWLVQLARDTIREIVEWWWRARIRSRATLMWLGKGRRFVIEVVLGGFLGVGSRKHIDLLDAILWQTQTIYLWGTLILWGTLFTLLPKEKYTFSRWYAFVGSLLIFLSVARFTGPEGFRVVLEGTAYRFGHLSVAIVILYVAADMARRLVWNKRTASEVFQLGPLGWITAAGLIAFV